MIFILEKLLKIFETIITKVSVFNFNGIDDSHSVLYSNDVILILENLLKHETWRLYEDGSNLQSLIKSSHSFIMTVQQLCHLWTVVLGKYWALSYIYISLKRTVNCMQFTTKDIRRLDLSNQKRCTFQSTCEVKRKIRIDLKCRNLDKRHEMAAAKLDSLLINRKR